jgi:hypothetical protein
MRRLRIYFVVCTVLAVAVALGGVAAADPPPPGAVPDNFTITNPFDNGFTADVYIGLDSAPFLLPTATCPFIPADPRSGVHPQLRADVRGWQVLPDLITLPKLVSLHAEVHGTIDDAAGNTYRLNGSFDEADLQPFHVPFQGYGHLTLAGKSGVVTGTALFKYVNDNPVSWAFLFSNINNCQIH